MASKFRISTQSELILQFTDREYVATGLSACKYTAATTIVYVIRYQGNQPSNTVLICSPAIASKNRSKRIILENITTICNNEKVLVSSPMIM